jgi:hypothetical protein
MEIYPTTCATPNSRNSKPDANRYGNSDCNLNGNACRDPDCNSNGDVNGNTRH